MILLFCSALCATACDMKHYCAKPSTYWCKKSRKILDFCRFYPFFYVSRPLCTQGQEGALKLSNTWHNTATGKVITLLGPPSVYTKDTSLLQTLASARSHGVCNSEVPMYIHVPYCPENEPPSKISPLPSLTHKFLHRYFCLGTCRL